MRYVTPAVNYLNAVLYDHLQIEPTTRCNLSCAICPHRDGMPIVDIQFRTLRSIMSRHRNTRLITLQGLGEPLMHPMFDEICCSAKRYTHTLQTYTNGMLWNESALEYLDHITVSLDTMDATKATEIKGAGYNLSTVLHNIKRYNRIISTTVNFTRSAYNYADLPLVEAWCKDSKVPLNVTRVQNWTAPEESLWDDRHTDVMKERELFGRIPLQKSLCQWRTLRWYYYRADGKQNPCCRRMGYRTYDATCCDNCPD